MISILEYDTAAMTPDWKPVFSRITEDVVEILKTQSEPLNTTQLLKLLYKGKNAKTKSMIVALLRIQRENEDYLGEYCHKSDQPHLNYAKKMVYDYFYIKPKEMTTEERRAVIKSHEEQAAREALKDIL